MANAVHLDQVLAASTHDTQTLSKADCFKG